MPNSHTWGAGLSQVRAKVLQSLSSPSASSTQWVIAKVRQMPCECRRDPVWEACGQRRASCGWIALDVLDVLPGRSSPPPERLSQGHCSCEKAPCFGHTQECSLLWGKSVLLARKPLAEIASPRDALDARSVVTDGVAAYDGCCGCHNPRNDADMAILRSPFPYLKHPKH